MRKLLGNAPAPPRGSLTRISVTRSHCKRIRPGRGQKIYVLPCPVHTEQTPRLAIHVKYQDKLGVLVNAGHEYVCVLCWSPQGAAPADKPSVGELRMVVRGEAWAPREIRLGSSKRLIMQPKGRTANAYEALYVLPCAPGEHSGRTPRATIFRNVSKSDALKFGWFWVARSEARVCLFCWSFWDERETGLVELPPWAQKSS